ncbi:CYTH domain-containing protein [Ornithinibacillus sp. FSL M8-0202]|uniref:CYTH domain-containing protein n=1 Tax=unclassified Ornithinibacillus TaxID=2620869 RepID=UPI0030D20627
MAQEIEIEYKNLLTKEEYETLLHNLPFPKEGKEQINYYFETADFKLRQHHAALRIRKKNNQYQLTLKEPHQDGLLETHDSLTEAEALSWISQHPIAKEATTIQLNQMNIETDELHYVGSLTTIRREYQENGLIIVLDYSQYNHVEDYELEIESQSKEAGLKALTNILETYHITQKDTPNKIARFFSSLS